MSKCSNYILQKKIFNIPELKLNNFILFKVRRIEMVNIFTLATFVLDYEKRIFSLFFISKKYKIFYKKNYRY